jgi:dolichol-phosphate mannosyltransferase
VTVASGWIVVPAYDEELALPRFLRTLVRALEDRAAEGGHRFTILVVDDGSNDRTSSVVDGFDPGPASSVRVKRTTFLRNFGHQAALVAGLAEASDDADYVITMDADGEHPPELLPALIERWEAGEDVVHTRRLRSSELPALKQRASSLYYRLLKLLSGIEISPGMADFKLWDGELLRAIRPYLPTCNSTRAFAAWLSPHSSVVPYEQRVAAGRTSRFTPRKMFSLAMQGIVQHSEVPLRFALIIGVVALAFALFLSAFAVWGVVTGHTVPGWASIIIAVATFSGMQSISIGILGEYLLRNSFRRSLPRFVLRSSGSRRSSRGAEHPAIRTTRSAS